MALLSPPSLTVLVNSVRNLLNQPDPTNSFWSDQELIEYINEGCRTFFLEVIENNEGLFTTVVDLNLVAGQEEVALPTDAFKVKALYRKVQDGFIVLPYINDVMRDITEQGAVSGMFYQPHYFFRKNSLVLRPRPTESETDGLRLEYIQFPESLVQSTDFMVNSISPIFKQVIEMYAVMKAKLKESLVNGTDTTSLARSNLAELVGQLRATIKHRSSYPQFVTPYNPGGNY